MKVKLGPKSSKILWALLYFFIVIIVCIVGVFCFHRFYYTFFYVSGPSMSPTLNSRGDGYYDFGIVDSHSSIFKYLKRNDIVITYYPEDFVYSPIVIEELEEGTFLLGCKDKNGSQQYISNDIEDNHILSTSSYSKAASFRTVKDGDTWTLLSDNGYLYIYESEDGHIQLGYSNVPFGFKYSEKGNSLYTTLLVNGENVRYFIGLNDDGFYASDDANQSVYTHARFYDFNYELKPYSDSKIKRVVGMPNETIKISHETISTIDENNVEKQEIINTIEITSINGVTFDYELPFVPNNPYGLKSHEGTWTLGPDEYFLMGDNWGHSTDSTDPRVGPIDIEMMTGILIAVEGYCQKNGDQPINMVYTTPRFFKQ